MVRRTVRLPFSKSEPTFDNVITVKEVIKVADPSGDGTMTVLEIVGLIAAILFAVFLATKLTRAVKKIMARRGANRSCSRRPSSLRPGLARLIMHISSPSSPARTCAKLVFPQPGGPYRR